MRALPTVCLVVVFGLVACAPGAQAGEWEFEIAPYLWVADVRADVSLLETDIANVAITFSEIIDDADLAALVHFEGHKGRGGLFVDVVFLALSDDQPASGGPLIPAGTTINTELDLLIGELGGSYRMTGDEKGLELLYGVRVTDVSLDVNIDFPDTSLLADRSRSNDETPLDGLIGLRFAQDISERWQWSIRGDVSAGDTDLTWQGVLTVGAKFGKDRDNILYFGYRHLAYEFDQGSGGFTDREIEFSGALVGFGFGF